MTSHYETTLGLVRQFDGVGAMIDPFHAGFQRIVTAPVPWRQTRFSGTCFGCYAGWCGKGTGTGVARPIRAAVPIAITSSNTVPAT